ncbi:uncharacterized protein STEHIDRAFT_153224 [Stereum hirsutum FP-91666 SS1]|uniref:uncharacterized protein n=1 Tax=Stereum hirsutum (strain FP-91666) TaxID=721885 RepID=UPI000440F4C4|nr:uncharacterized protein STEHIDRAFT_153224 [Stereum hirsutum FP-91666 SS1]EIM91594.1 hypothetical protein STEHIDRAFT_153224 [Stereum hirsutum FP-91666 SS1]
MSSSSISTSRGPEEQTSSSPSSDAKSSPSPSPPPFASGDTDPISQADKSSAEQKAKSQSLVEKDAELLAKMQGRDGGDLAVEPGEWNGLAKNVKDNMFRYI